MDIYSSDLKLSELSMNLGPHLSYQHQSLLHQFDSHSSSSLASDSSPLYDNGSAYAIVDVLDFLETGLHESPKTYSSFGQDSNPEDNDDQWLEFLNPPVDSSKFKGQVGALTFRGDDNVVGGGTGGRSDFMASDDGLDYMDGEQKIKSEEEHSYSLCKEADDDDDDDVVGLNEFKLHFDGDLELFQADDMDQDDFDDSGRKLNVIGDLLFVDGQTLGLGVHEPEDGRVPLLGTISPEDSNPSPYDCNNSNVVGSNDGGLSFEKKKPRSVGSGLTEFCQPLVCRIKTEPEEMQQDDVASYGSSILNSVGLPPTPPSSGCGVNSDSDDCSNSVGGLLAGGTSASPHLTTREVRNKLLFDNNNNSSSSSNKHSTSLFSTPIPSSGILILSEEEKRTLLAEGYSLPSKLPLSKQEEKNLKKIRRKIKNKISAQESRRKKKEYLESLEKKVEQMTQENSSLKKKMTMLESNNKSLTSELQRLQSLASKVMKNVNATTTATIAKNGGGSCASVK